VDAEKLKENVCVDVLAQPSHSGGSSASQLWTCRSGWMIRNNEYGEDDTREVFENGPNA